MKRTAPYHASLNKIGVAVAFDARLETILCVAERFGRAVGGNLRLMHVCDPWTKSYLATAVEAGPPELVKTLKDESERVAERRLASLLRTMPN